MAGSVDPEASTRPRDAPRRVIGGRYAVLGELGRGGMGVVWRAEDTVLGRRVAVKELHLLDGLDPAERHRLRERLLREARTAARLHDPGIVTVHDLVTDRGLDHVVMELVEGRTLGEVVARDGPLDERTALTAARGLLAALHAVHAAGVTHRDIKPSNVMLGPDGRVTLTDFGIARAADDTRMTGTGLVVGSAAYLAPELLAGGDATPASDLWALGATLFHAVEGYPAFARDTTAATVGAVLHGDIPPVRTGGPVAAVVAGLLQRDPAARLTAPQARALLGVGPPAAPAAD
ncbi:serine/threonine-protein kinase, partial [Pseudonocardia lacus]|uniref:serine/threonine-protein kinase n=1 Tax=Pseudonocardia lacus TaxID=2835865 RepID=UPI001BDD1334